MENEDIDAGNFEVVCEMCSAEFTAGDAVFDDRVVCPQCGHVCIDSADDEPF